MGLGRLLTRSTVYTATDTVSGISSTYTVIDNIGPDWPTSSAYRGAMGIPGAWRATVLLSDLLGIVPWHAYDQTPGQDEELIVPDPPLLEQPAPPDTRMTTMSSMGLDLIWHGNAIGIVAARDSDAVPTAIVPTPAETVGVRRVPVNDPDRSPLRPGSIEYSVGSLRFGSQDVIHIKGPCKPGALRGLGVLEAHVETLELSRSQQRQARSISNHGVPTGIIQSDDPDLEPEEAADMKSAWLEAQAQRSIAVLNGATKFQPVAWRPDEMQMVEARKFSLTELELIFGLPVGWLGGQQSSKQYSNTEMDAVNLLKFSLGGHLGRFEQTFSLALPRNWQARATLDAILRSDTLSRYQAYALALDPQKGWMERNEVRGIERLKSLPDKPTISDEFRPNQGSEAANG